MRVTRRTLLIVVAIVVALLASAAVVLGPRLVEENTVGKRPRGDRRGVDLERYRASYQQRLDAARRLVARRKAARAATARDAGTPLSPEQHRARGLAKGVWQTTTEPQCMLGPAELCMMLAETGTECADGDAQSCLAVGQYLVDTPPRPLIAIGFFAAACKLGDDAGCAREKEVKEPMTAPCTDDIFRCAWLAYRSQDAARLDEACSEGVADACSWLIMTADDADDLVRSRTYLEHACQLGSPFACEELGRRLDPRCRPERPISEDGQPMYFPCFPPDPDQAAEARAIACEAGFAEACS